jgi:hypothetical protein
LQLRDSTISAEPPGLRAAKAWYSGGALAGLAAGLGIAEVTSLGLGLPLMLGTAVALVLGYRRRRRALTDVWQHRHRVLRHAEDTLAFTTARQACDEVIDAWPRISAMVGVADPGPALVQSLWTLSEVLVDRGALRDQRDELEQARIDLPVDTEEWREVDDRVAQLDAALAAFDTQVDARLATFTDLSERCRRYVREERATARAREALRRADRAPGAPGTPPTSLPGAVEPARELAGHTTAVLAAYHELTRKTSPS